MSNMGPGQKGSEGAPWTRSVPDTGPGEGIMTRWSPWTPRELIWAELAILAKWAQRLPERHGSRQMTIGIGLGGPLGAQMALFR
jgi:hypothetical protein